MREPTIFLAIFGMLYGFVCLSALSHSPGPPRMHPDRQPGFMQQGPDGRPEPGRGADGHPGMRRRFEDRRDERSGPPDEGGPRRDGRPGEGQGKRRGPPPGEGRRGEGPVPPPADGEGQGPPPDGQGDYPPAPEGN